MLCIVYAKGHDMLLTFVLNDKTERTSGTNLETEKKKLIFQSRRDCLKELEHKSAYIFKHQIEKSRNGHIKF